MCVYVCVCVCASLATSVASRGSAGIENKKGRGAQCRGMTGRPEDFSKD